MPRHRHDVLRFDRQNIFQPRRPAHIRHLFNGHDEMSARIHPRDQRIRLARTQVRHRLRIEIDRVEAFEQERIIRQHRRLETCRGRLHVRLIAFDGSQRNYARRCARQRPDDLRLPTHCALRLHAQRILHHSSALIHQPHIPRRRITIRHEGRDDDSLQRARRQLHRHTLRLTFAIIRWRDFDDASDGRAVIEDFASDRKPRRLAHRSVVTREHIEAQFRPGAGQPGNGENEKS